MEITSGKLRGFTLVAPDGEEILRPTSVRMRQAFFDSLGDLSGKVFADLCAGTGAMGIEAASRGASTVVFAEKAPESLRVLKRNVSRAAARCPDVSFFISDGALPESASKLHHFEKPDILFADPPYADSTALLAAMTSNADFTSWAEAGTLFWEFPSDVRGILKPPDAPWKMDEIRRFGQVRVLIFRVFSEKMKKK